MQINDWPIFGCKVGQNVPIGMKLQLDVWHHLLDVYAKFQTDISKHVQKSPENFSLAGSSTNAPLSSVFVRQRAKNCPTMTKISRDQDTRNTWTWTWKKFIWQYTVLHIVQQQSAKSSGDPY